MAFLAMIVGRKGAAHAVVAGKAKLLSFLMIGNFYMRSALLLREQFGVAGIALEALVRMQLAVHGDDAHGAIREHDGLAGRHGQRR